MTESATRRLHVLIIADPGAASKRIASLTDELEEELRQVFDMDVYLETCTQTVRVQSDHQLELAVLDSFVNSYPDVDAVLMLTGIPRHTDRKPLVAEILDDRKVAVVSYPTLGAWPSKRRVKQVLTSCANQLLPYGPPADTYPFMPRWGHWSDRTESGSQTLHAHTFTGGPRLVLGMTSANNPVRMASKLSRALAAASATGAFGIFYNSIWQMSHHLSVARLISIGVIAIAVMVAWLITVNRLWDRPVRERLAPVVLYYNLSTILTLLLCVVTLYVSLVAGILAGSLIIIDPGFMSQTIKSPATFSNYLDIAWLSAALGVVAGALGSTFDSDADIKNLTHAQRLRMRVYSEDESG